jgi:hypothetical protein
MEDSRNPSGEGLYRRVDLRPQQYAQLLTLADKAPKEGFIKLVKQIKEAPLRRCTTTEMTRKQRAEWAADELMEPTGEVETLLEEMEGWISNQQGTTFSATAQHAEVAQMIVVLKGVVAKLINSRDELMNLEFPGWKQAKDAQKRQEEELRARIAVRSKPKRPVKRPTKGS